MQENPHIKNLLQRYRNNTITKKEFEMLMEYIGEQNNEAEIHALLEEHWTAITKLNPDAIDTLDKTHSSDGLLFSIMERIEETEAMKRKAAKKSYYKWGSIAASVIVIMSLTIFLNKGDNKSPQLTQPIIVNNNIETGTDKATLTLESGEIVNLVKGTAFQTQNASSNGEEIVYDAKNKTAEIAYNTLTIPRGGQFQITLADGTKVWLNSETQLKYPVSFADGESRQVELVYGEAYFDVSPSTAHNGSKFKVYSQSQNIEVLGTEFNIRAYKYDANIYTTLVEGKVEVSNKKHKAFLLPGQKSDLNTTTDSINILTADIYRDIAWKQGVFSFKNMTLKEIMKVLSRWYDIQVIFEDEQLEKITFNGTLEKQLDIVKILSIFKNTNNINYEIHNKTVSIKQ